MLEGIDIDTQAAMANEFRRGMVTLAAPDVADGLARFQSGAGRGGAAS